MVCFLSTKLSSESVAHQLSQIKHDISRNTLLILYIFNVFSMTLQLLFIHSITKKYNWYCKKCQSLWPNVLIVCPKFWQNKNFGCTFASPAPTPLASFTGDVIEQPLNKMHSFTISILYYPKVLVLYKTFH